MPPRGTPEEIQQAREEEIKACEASKKASERALELQIANGISAREYKSYVDRIDGIRIQILVAKGLIPPREERKRRARDYLR